MENRKFNLSKIMKEAHLLYACIRERGVSFAECLRRIWAQAKQRSDYRIFERRVSEVRSLTVEEEARAYGYGLGSGTWCGD